MSSYRRVSHAASDEITPLSKGDRTLSSIMPLLGPPSMPVDFNVEDRLSHEQWPVEKLFEDKQVYLENSISTMVMRTHNPFVTNVLMPLKYHDAISFVWSKWHAHRTLAAQTPQGAPPERVTQSREQFRAVMNRYELGFVVNAESLVNPEGEFALALDLATVAVAFGDLFEQLGLTALLQRKHYHRERLRRLHDPFANAADVFAYEKLFWDIVRKDPKGLGFYTLREEVKKAQREIISTAAVLPEGLKSLLAAGEANQFYYFYGPGARTNVEYGSDAIGRRVADLQLHVVREIELDRNGVRVRPMHRVKTIGDHFRLEDYASDCLPSAYRSCSRTIKVFDMSEPRGVFKPIDFLAALRATARFNADGSLDLQRHEALAADPISKSRRAGLPVVDGFIDMFLFLKDDQTSYGVTKYLGQMEDEALPMSAVRATAETIVARVLEGKTTTNVQADLQAGLRLINKIFNKKLTEADVNNIATVVATGSANEYGTHDLDVLEASVATTEGNFLPAGYGSVAGLYTIANVDPNSKVGRALGKETIATADAFVGAIDELHRAFAPLFHTDHPIMSGKAVPEHFTSSFQRGSRAQREMHAKISFAQTFIDAPKAPLYVHSRADTTTLPPADGSLEKAPELLKEASVDGDEATKAVVNAARARLASGATPAVRRAFATSESIRDFCTAYEASPFAAAYKRHATATASDPAARAAANTTSFSLFASTHLAEQLAAPSTAFVNVMHNLVDAVTSAAAVRATNMERTLAAWATTPPTGAAAPAAARSTGSAAVRSRLVVAPHALDKVASAGVLSMHSGINRNIEPDFTTDEDLGSNQFTPLLVGTTEYLGKDVADYTNNYRRRYRAVANETDGLLRAAMMLVLQAPVHFNTFERFYHNNVRVPLAILGERPLRRYEAASVIFVAPGEELGEIAWTNYNIMLSSNAMTKQHEGNASIWACAVVKDEARTYLAEDVFVTGYYGGESLEPYSPETYDPANLDTATASVFYFLCPVGSLRGPSSVSKTHDITGRYRSDIIENRLTETALRLVVNKPHYPSALYYSQVYQWNKLRVLAVDETEYFKVDGRADNTVTHQTMQYMWNPVTGTFSEAILNTDHFGQNIYEGHGDLRTMGAAMMYKDCAYKFAPTD